MEHYLFLNGKLAKIRHSHWSHLAKTDVSNCMHDIRKLESTFFLLKLKFFYEALMYFGTILIIEIMTFFLSLTEEERAVESQNCPDNVQRTLVH